MKHKIIFAIIPLILSIGIISVLPLSDALQPEDVDTQCREGLVLIFRINSNNYVCVTPETAEKWVEWGIGEFVESDLEEEFEKKTSMDEESEEIKFCTAQYDPVCGVDGITYGNSCEADVANVEIAHIGMCGEGEIGMEDSMKKEMMGEVMIPTSIMDYTNEPPEIDPEKGYFVTEIMNGLYWLSDGTYQVMFLTTGEGVIVVDAPPSLGEKYLNAVAEVTDEPITHVIYSHIHKDHIGAANQFPDDATIIAHEVTAKHLEMKNDPNRPIPTVTFDDSYTLTVGSQTIELSYEGSFHSKGDIMIFAPKQNVLMVVDHFHPGSAPFKAFAITKDMNNYIAAHDKMLEIDPALIISGHTEILATTDHVKTNKEFTMAVLENSMTALQTVDFNEIVQEYGSLGSAAVFDAYIDTLARTCADLTMEQWDGRLHDVGVFMEDNCSAMVFHVFID